MTKFRTILRWMLEIADLQAKHRYGELPRKLKVEVGFVKSKYLSSIVLPRKNETRSGKDI